VVFRLTEDEYRTLRETCASKGGRNLSEFTRTELLAAVQSQSISGILQDRLRAMEDQISLLRLTLATLTEMMARGLATGAVNVGPSPSE
jgi:hypothetical protein